MEKYAVVTAKGHTFSFFWNVGFSGTNMGFSGTCQLGLFPECPWCPCCLGLFLEHPDFLLLLEHNKVDALESGVGEKTCQQAKARQSHSNNHPVRHGKVGVKNELSARVVLSLSTTVVLLYCVAAVENTFSFVGRALVKLNNKSSTSSD